LNWNEKFIARMPWQTEGMSSAGERFEIEMTPAPGDIEFLDDRLYEYNVEATGIRNGQLLAIFVRDAGNEIEAGISGWTWGDCSRIDKLWVRADRRAGGLGWPCSTDIRARITSAI
jgi:hypothetical protein